MRSSRRSGQAPCFFCGLTSPNAEEWKKHNRSCWAGYKRDNEPAQSQFEEQQAVQDQENSELLQSQCVNPMFVEELSIFLHLRITCTRHREHIFSVFQKHGITKMGDILRMSQARFDSLLSEINVDIVASRLKQSRT
jgi:hypothetical protein